MEDILIRLRRRTESEPTAGRTLIEEAAKAIETLRGWHATAEKDAADYCDRAERIRRERYEFHSKWNDASIRALELIEERDHARRELGSARSELGEERRRVKFAVEKLRKVEKGKDESREDLANMERLVDKLNARVTEQVQEVTDLRTRLRQVFRMAQTMAEIAEK